MAVIGLDLGGTKLSSAIFDEQGVMLHKESTLLDKRQGSAVGKLVTDKVKRMMDIATQRKLDVHAVGVAVPGIYRHASGCVWAPNIQDWTDYPLLQELISFINNKSIAVEIDSDRTCYILGEVWQGNATDCRNAIFLSIGTGIGAGILCDGLVLHGVGSVAGALGWLSFCQTDYPKYKDCGFLEYYASGDGLVRAAIELMDEDDSYNGQLRNYATLSLTAQNIFTALVKSDPIAQRVIKQAIELWGIAVANLVSIFNPELIIFGGGVFGPASVFLGDIHSEARKWAQPLSINMVKLVASKLKGDAGLYGAAYLALQTYQK